MRIVYLLLGVSVSGIVFAGCGGTAAGTPDGSATAASSAAAEPASSAATPPAVVLPVTAESTPQEVVLAFLNGMRDANSGVTAGLLTDIAQAETVKHDWPVQPPGAPSATYQLGESTFLDQQQTAVQVPCIWSESDGAGGKIEFQVVWVLRRQTQGWRVAGFASEVVPGQPAYFFNFEDIANLKAAQTQAEAALSALANPSSEGNTAVAENPAGDTTRR